MNLRKTPLLLLAVLALSCSPASDNRAAAPFDQKKLADQSADFCSQGTVLKEVEMPGQLSMEDIGGNYKVIGFYNHLDHRCAVKGAIHDMFPWFMGMAHFDFTASIDCVPNGSLWKVTDYGNSSPDTLLELESLDIANPVPTILINATRDVGAAYARDHTGLRLMTCH